MTAEPGSARTALPAVGDHLTPVVKKPTRVTGFLFSVAWWTPHRVHYDVEFARGLGYSDVMVPGLLLNEYAVAALTRWTGDPTTLRRLRIRNMAPAVAGDTITVTTEVTAVHDDGDVPTVDCTFELRKQDGTVVAAGDGTVEVR